MRGLLRKIVRLVFLLLELVAGVAFFIAVLLNDQNPLADKLWVLCASAGLAIIAVGWLDRYFDAQDAEALRKELEAAKQLAENLKSRIPRCISDAGKEAMKKALSKYPQISIQIVTEDDDGEIHVFTRNMSAVLRQCGCWGGPPSTVARSVGQGVWICSGPRGDGPDWAVEIIRDITAVLEADGISVSKCQERISLMPMLPGCIEMNIGKRPRP